MAIERPERPLELVTPEDKAALDEDERELHAMRLDLSGRVAPVGAGMVTRPLEPSRLYLATQGAS